MCMHVSMDARVHECVSMYQCVGVHKSCACEWEGTGGGGLCAGPETGRALLWSWLQAGIDASGDQQVERESHREIVGQGGLWAVH